MNKQTLISTIVLWIWVVAFSVGVVSTNKANANEEIINLQKEIIELENRNVELDLLIQEESDGYRVDEYAIWECEESYRKSQAKRNKKADWYRAEKQENEEQIQKIKDRLGLLLSR